ncbi:hypothetical protein KY290_013979 [Solanum tuberosum]|uniref:Uncharacterized protein n=1 Tax=Solanum tuberosum TaxID=4113 RepID=A0ABQ7VNE2_SOLTU|nr:hypothetical protein KY290_013979 [Solanum tuberosum]
MSKKRTEEVSINLSPSKRDMQTNINDEQPIICYIPRKRRKKGQPVLEECTQQVHPPRKELSHITFHDFKEKMTVPVAQVPSFTLEPSKGNTQVGYNFSNPTKLGELTEEVTGEKIHGLTKSQMLLRKQGYYVATPKFGLGFSLPETLRISSKKGEEITSSHYPFIENTKESKEDWAARMKEDPLNKWMNMPPPQRLLYFIAWELKESHYPKGGEKKHNCCHQPVSWRTKKEEDEAITVGSQMEDSNLTQSSYHIIVEEGPDIDDTDDDVQEAPLNWRMAYNQP